MSELSYTVNSGFSAKVDGADRWFTRENQDEVKSLPRALRDDLIAAGVIEERNAKGEVTERVSAPSPAAPATTTGKEK
jgi:hypothetical protein